MRRLLLATAMLATLATGAAAHEFWIAPRDADPAPGETVSADFRVGTLLEGPPFPWLDKVVASAMHYPPEGAPRPLTSRIGDRPALTFGPVQPGLHLVTTVTHPAYITYDSFDDFAEYLEYEGLDLDPGRHAARGLDPASISEAYVRNAKTLFAVGDLPEGVADLPTGMDYELTASGHPFRQGALALTVILTWMGRPVPDATVIVLRARPGADATRRHIRTGPAGRVTVPLDGPGEYLLSAVRMAPVDGPGTVRWKSHWASLYFELPE